MSSVKFDKFVNTSMMDKDLIVFIDSEEPHKPKVLIEKDEDDSYVAMLTFVPDFRLVEHKMEAIFLVDCSGSMGGQSMDLAKEALQVFLHSLPVSTYFNVIIFGSSHQSLFPESKIYDDNNFRDAESSVRGISANGTRQFKSLISYKCDTGHVLVGRSELMCDVDQRWNGPPPRCEPVYCEEPQQIRYGGFSLSTNSTRFGTVVTYYCTSPRHELVGPKKITCLKDGSYNDDPPSCREVGLKNTG